MSVPNSSDSPNIQALLETLRTSQAWAAAVGAASPDATEPPTQGQSSSGPASFSPTEEYRSNSSHNGPQSRGPPPADQPSIASLLSQLQPTALVDIFPSSVGPVSTVDNYVSSRAFQNTSNVLDNSECLNGFRGATDAPFPPVSQSRPAVDLSHRQKDFRGFTFQQSLSRLATLAEDEKFLEAIAAMKREQDTLERKLWEERHEIFQRHDKKVKAAKARAQIVGGNLSKHDAEMLSAAVQRELKQFDLERALPAWDGLTVKHQAAMEILTVPSMFVTSDPSHLQKQQKVMKVLEGFLSGEN